MKKKWSKEALQSEADRYSSRGEFKKCNPSAYAIACQQDLLDGICAHMGRAKIWWSLELLITEGLKYKTRIDFMRGSPSAYSVAQKRNLLDQICKHMVRPLVERVSYAMLHDRALQYQTRTEFADGDQTYYNIARKRGLLNQVCGHMTSPYEAWSEEKIMHEAIKYKNRKAFFDGSNGAYRAAIRLNILDKVCSHMIQLYESFSENGVFETGKKYSSRTEFLKNDSKAYHAAHRHGILDKVCEHMPDLSGTSRAELEVLSWVRSLGFVAHKQRWGHQEADVFIPEIKTAIEYNGLYWHSEKFKDHNFHLNKTNFLHEQGVRTIHIFEHEWIHRQSQVKSFLRSALGKNENRIGARKCVFQEISRQEAVGFLETYHIQGGINNIKLALGAFYRGELIQVATFGVHHRDSTAMVLNRFAGKENWTVSGCLAKMSKIACTQLGSLVSWCDLRWSIGHGYEAAGWIKETQLKPDYFYCDKHTTKIISKQSRKKSIVNTPEGMTEHEHALQDGLLRVWDCGKIRYRFKLDVTPPGGTI